MFQARLTCWPLIILLSVLRLDASGQTASGSLQSATDRLRALDRNGDGKLQTAEIPDAQRSQIERLAKRRGLDSSQPLSLQLLISETNNESTPLKPDKKDESIRDKSKQGQAFSIDIDKEPSAAEPASSVPGFGNLDARPRVPGFGVETAAPSRSPSVPAEGEKNASQNSSDKRLKRLAKSMMVQHDTNKNGRLEKDEWGRLRGNPQNSDRNKDGTLTLDELSQHLAGYGRRRDERIDKPSTQRPKSSRTVRSKRRANRFFTPSERLPKGLPGWFLERDQDGDGQLALIEYASSLSSASLRKFTELDLNNDGFIVPNEVPRTQTPK